MYGKLIVPVLPPLCNFVTNRLNALWGQALSRSGGAGGFASPGGSAGAGSAKSEIVEEKILRELTRDFAELLLSVTQQTGTSTVLKILKQGTRSAERPMALVRSSAADACVCVCVMG